MSWIADMSPSRKRATILGVAAVLGVAVVLGGGFAIISGTSHAADAPKENCQGLDQALQNNLNFIAQQKANPTAVSAANIANRQAVVDQIQQRRKVAGCTNNVSASGASNGSGENCNGLQTALQNNLNFIADQKAHPDAQSAARIANRQAVVDQIEQRLKAAGCSDSGSGAGCPTATDTNTDTSAPPTTTDNGMGNGMGNGGMGTDTTAPPTTTDNGMGYGMGTDTTAPPTTTDNGMGNGGMGTDTTDPSATDTSTMGSGCDNGGMGTDTTDPSATDTATADPTDTNTGSGTATGTAANQVCKGSTVTTSGAGGLTASSNQFAKGTMLKVTNLDNNQSITVPVTSTSGSCVLLDSGAFNKIHEAGKQLIRHALIQKVG
jgi:hypothetical protein